MVKKPGRILLSVVIVFLLSACGRVKELEVGMETTELPEIGVPYYNVSHISGGKIYYSDYGSGFDYVAYDIDSGEKDVLLHRDWEPAFTSHKEYDTICAFTISDREGTNLYLIRDDAEPVLFHHKDLTQINTISFSDEYILFENDVYENGSVTEVLQKIDADTLETEDIVSAEYMQDSNTGKMYGSMVAYAGGDSEYIYYQIINMDGCSADTSEDYDFFRYDISDQSVEKLPGWEYMAMYISGIGEYMLVSEYNSDYPLDDSGKILHPEENGYSVIDIPGIYNANDIHDAHAYGNSGFMLFHSSKDLYVFDALTKEVKTLLTFSDNQILLDYNSAGAVVIEDRDGKLFMINITVTRP